MPGPRTEFQKRFNEYVNAMLAVLGNSQPSNEFAIFMEDLDNLSIAIDENPIMSLNEFSERNNYVEGEDFDSKRDIQHLYAKLIESASRFLQIKNPSSMDKRLGTVVSEISKICVKDLDLINRIPPNSELRLEEALAEARKDVLDISGGKTTSLGGAFSSRIPIMYRDDNGKLVKGFFTKEKNLNNWRDDFGKLLAKSAEKHPNLKDFYACFAKYAELRVLNTFDFGRILNNNMPNRDDNILEQAEYIFDNLEDYRNNIEADGYDYGKMWDDLDVEELLTALNEISREAAAIEIMEESYVEEIDAKIGSSIDERNCAMSSIANLLDGSSLIANAHKVTVVNNGEMTTGCFMENVVGSDVARPYQGDPLLKWAKKAGKDLSKLPVSDEVAKQLMDMQVLDFICGNVDRHSGNVIYSFDIDPKHPDNIVLSGVKGIDNDFSFGTKIERDSSVTIDEMSVISASMAEKVMTLSPEMIGVALAGYNLAPEEKQAAIDRLVELKNQIQVERRLENGKGLPGDEHKLTVLDDREITFEKAYEISKTHKTKKENLIQKVGSVTERVKSIEKETLKNNNGKLPSFKSTNFTGAVLGDSREREPLDGNVLREKLEAIKEKLQGADRALHKNTSEFKDMITSINEACETLKNSDPSNINDSLSHTRLAMQKVKNFSSTYISKKPPIPKTEMGQKRIAAARDLRSLASDAIEQINGYIFAPKEPQGTFMENNIKLFDKAIENIAKGIEKNKNNPTAVNALIARAIAAQKLKEDFSKNPCSEFMEQAELNNLANSGNKIVESKEFKNMMQGKTVDDFLKAGKDFAKVAKENFMEMLKPGKENSKTHDERVVNNEQNLLL